MKASDIIRYIIWGGLLQTADANRRHFGLPTTWVFHATFNTLALMLPEIYGGLSSLLRLDRRVDAGDAGLLATGHKVMRDVVLDNPHYVEYVAPAALAYIVSHPHFNIYKDPWARYQVLGFGPDTIPHATTAFAISNLVFDTIDSLRRNMRRASPLADEVRFAQTHAVLISGAILALATTFYESGEYVIHNTELEATHGDESKINMEWDVEDTVTDVLSNLIGWFIAVLRHRQRGRYVRRRKYRELVSL